MSPVVGSIDSSFVKLGLAMAPIAIALPILPFNKLVFHLIHQENQNDLFMDTCASPIA